jgi:microcystin-dependent protein
MVNLNNNIVYALIVCLFVIIIYLIFCNKTKENFAVSDEVKAAINEVYQADIDAMRNLANISKSIMNNNDLLNIPANEVNMLGNINVNNNANIKGNLVVDGDVTFKAKNSNIMEIFPQYMVIAWAGEVIPTGWAICDGNKYILNNFGNAVRSIALNAIKTPDLRGRFVLGGGKGDNLTNRSFNENGGSETHKLTIEQIPTHNHSIDWSNLGCKGGLCGEFTALNKSGIYQGDWAYRTPQEKSGMPYNTGMIGGSQPHPIMPPFYVLTYIMKL